MRQRRPRLDWDDDEQHLPGLNVYELEENPEEHFTGIYDQFGQKLYWDPPERVPMGFHFTPPEEDA